jgi:parallel beta-helix repeat protein
MDIQRKMARNAFHDDISTRAWSPMISTNLRDLSVAALAFCVLAVVPQACGGGGSSSGGGASGEPQSTQPGGQTPGAEATPTVAPVVIPAGANIVEQVKRVAAGGTVIVLPGVYAPIVFNPGDLSGPVALIADETGQLSNGVAAPVIISSKGLSPAIEINGQSDVTLDGFTVHGAAGAGVLVKNSPRTVLLDCTISDTKGNGVQIESSDDTLVFNNLIFDNSGAGILVTGTNGLSIYNNTVYKSMASGISVGDAADPSSDVTLRNNILNSNAPAGIAVAESTSGYDGDYDLNNDGYDGVSAGANDITGTGPGTDPLFMSPDTGDFHLLQGLAGSTSPAIDAGDPDTSSDLVAVLQQRTTQTDGTLDTGPVDLGYHYLSALAFATPTPPPVPTSTRRPTAKTSATPTRTPTHGPTSTPVSGGHKPTPTKKPTPSH